MIDIAFLTKNDRGRWVCYGNRQRGRIKDWNEDFIYVVYHLDDQWDHFYRYTAAPTLPEDLEFVSLEHPAT
jgi:hypothetical protein